MRVAVMHFYMGNEEAYSEGLGVLSEMAPTIPFFISFTHLGHVLWILAGCYSCIRGFRRPTLQRFSNPVIHSDLFYLFLHFSCSNDRNRRSRGIDIIKSTDTWIF